MQIIQRLFKVAYERRETIKKKGSGSDGKDKSKEVMSLNHGGAANRSKPKRVQEGRFSCKNLKPFTVLRGRDIAQAWFYSTIHLRRLGSYNRKQHWGIHSMKMKNEDSGAHGHGGNTKVQPISDATLSSSRKVKGPCRVGEKGEKGKGDKTKTISKIKELLRWEAAAKGGNYNGSKVSHFPNRAILKSVLDDDQFRNESPKNSFRWDEESCPAISMASSTRNAQNMNMSYLTSTLLRDINQCTSATTGNWITTDSEFVVLEL